MLKCRKSIHCLIHCRVSRMTAGRPGSFTRCRNWKKPASGRSPSCRSPCASCWSRCCATTTASASREDDVRTLANWQPNAERTAEIPFVVARIVLQDFTGVPLLVDLAAMRSAVARLGRDPGIIEPLVPVDLVVDHSRPGGLFGSQRRPAAQHGDGVQAQPRPLPVPEVGHAGVQRLLASCRPASASSIRSTWSISPRACCPKTTSSTRTRLVGTDSHTTMINGLGIVGWGVGGIEAEAGMLGQPVYFLTPDVVGVHLTGALKPGVTATDLVLTITEMLRKRQSRRQVRRVPRRRRGVAVADRPGDHRQHGARIRRDHGLLPGGRRVLPLSDGHGPHGGAGGCLPPVFQGAGHVRDAQSRARSSTASCWNWTWRPCSRASPGRSARRTASTCRKSRRSSRNCLPAPAAYNKSLAEINKRFVIMTGVEGYTRPGKEPLTGGGEQDPATAPLPTDIAARKPARTPAPTPKSR